MTPRNAKRLADTSRRSAPVANRPVGTNLVRSRPGVNAFPGIVRSIPRLDGQAVEAQDRTFVRRHHLALAGEKPNSVAFVQRRAAALERSAHDREQRCPLWRLQAEPAIRFEL